MPSLRRIASALPKAIVPRIVSWFESFSTSTKTGRRWLRHLVVVDGDVELAAARRRQQDGLVGLQSLQRLEQRGLVLHALL